MVLSVYALILGAVLQALGKGFSSMALTIARQVVFLLPLLIILQNFKALPILWMAFPLAEIMGIIFALYLHKKKHSLFKSNNQNELNDERKDKNE